MRFPQELETERLIIRRMRTEQAAAINAAIRDSFAALNRWMAWAREVPSLDETAAFCRDAERQYEQDEGWGTTLWRKSDEALIGSLGCLAVDWSVPRLEIGYWCHSAHAGHGYVTEAVRAVTRYAFERLGCVRVEIRMDERNERSVAVPERLGFTREGRFVKHMRANDGGLRNTLVYALTELAELR